MGMPVYVKIDDCKDIMDILTLTQEKLQKARYLLQKIHELKAQEDAAFDKWKAELDEVERRVQDVDNKFSEPQV